MANDNRTVGTPRANKEFMRPRDVTVLKNAPNLNDTRKVKSRKIAEPQLGVRPNGGAQIEPKAPPDKLGGNYIGARDVPMKTMTETELAEWNPLAALYHTNRPSKVAPGIAIGYEYDRDGITISVVRDGSVIKTDRVDSRQSIDQKFKDLQAQYAELQKQRRQVSINPYRTAKKAAEDIVRANKLPPSTKFGQLHKEILTTDDLRRFHTPEQQPSPHQDNTPNQPALSNDTEIQRPSPSAAVERPRERGYGMPYPKPFDNNRQQWDKRAGKPSGQMPNASRQNAFTPTTPAEQPQNDASMQDQLLKGANPKHWTDARLAATTPLNKEQAIRKLKMSGGGVREGYPDTDIEKDGEPFHQSRISDLSWDAHLRKHPKDPKMPDLNREFIQARDLSIERVTEKAEQGIDEMLQRTLRKMGLRESNPKDSDPDEDWQNEDENDPVEQAAWRARIDKKYNVDQNHKKTTKESAVPRTRARWV